MLTTKLSRLLSLGLGLSSLSAMAVLPKFDTKKTVQFSKATYAVPGEFVVKYNAQKSGQLGISALRANLNQLGMELKSTVNAEQGVYLVKAAKVASLKNNPSATLAMALKINDIAGVEYAEPNYLYYVMGEASEVTPDAPEFSKLWAMKNVGQPDSSKAEGKVGADIKATFAWKYTTGSKDVLVAVIDTGLNYNHPDLKDNVWTEMVDGKPSHGFNAINGSRDPMDDHGHGSHCSGSIGASGAHKIVGVNWKSSIMGVKFLSAQGGGSLADAIKAIDFATTKKAKIMSNSWGGGGYSQALFDSIKRAGDSGALFVAAAGNDGSNNDSNPTYPGSYEIPQILAVAATDNRDRITSWSNYGARIVHVAAPGNNIYSTTLNDEYDSWSGTSMATPHVSGAAALLLSQEPNLTPLEIKARIMKSADRVRGLRNKVQTGARLNVYNMIMNKEGAGDGSVPDSAWSAVVANPISSEHPYKDNTKQSWTIRHPGATHIRLVIENFATEARYDTLTIKDGKGEVLEVLSGNVSRGYQTMEAAGDTMILEFVSDDSVNGRGFDIKGYQWANFSGSNL